MGSPRSLAVFAEEFSLIVSAKHRLASHSPIDIDELREERWLRRAYCEEAEKTASVIRTHDLDLDPGHELTSERDLITLLESDFGVAFVPRSTPRPQTLKQAGQWRRIAPHISLWRRRAASAPR